MTTASHSVAPEEVMAFLDGELSTYEMQVVSAHISKCSECAQLVRQFRGTAERLSGWSLPAVADEVENALRRPAAEAASWNGKRKLRSSVRPLRWKLWPLAAVGALVAFVVLNNLASRTFRRDRMLSASEFRQAASARATADAGGRGVALDATRSLALKDRVASGNDFPASEAPAPMLARTVSLVVTVKDVEGSRTSLEHMLARHHAYFAQLTVDSQFNGARSLQSSLRIPFPELNSALSDLKTLGEVENETQSAEDVTQQHQDLAQRLRTARDTEDRFRAILQQRGGGVADVLAVEEGIARVRGDIERMEAEQTTLEHRVDYASVDLRLAETYNPAAAQGDSIGIRLRNSLLAGYRNASATFLAVVLFFVEDGPPLLVLLLIFGLPAYLLVRRYRRKHSRL